MSGFQAPAEISYFYIYTIRPRRAVCFRHHWEQKGDNGLRAALVSVRLVQLSVWKIKSTGVSLQNNNDNSSAAQTASVYICMAGDAQKKERTNEP
jgi:hypothetical protein